MNIQVRLVNHFYSYVYKGGYPLRVSIGHTYPVTKVLVQSREIYYIEGQAGVAKEEQTASSSKCKKRNRGCFCRSKFLRGK